MKLPTTTAYELVRDILKLHPDIRVNRGAVLVEAYVQKRIAAVAEKPKKNTTDHVADITDPVRDARNSEEPK